MPDTGVAQSLGSSRHSIPGWRASQSTRRSGMRVGVRDQRERGAQHRLPVSLILLVSMTAAGVVYPVTDSALQHTSPIMIATLRAVVGGLLLTACCRCWEVGCRGREDFGCGRLASGL